MLCGVCLNVLWSDNNNNNNNNNSEVLLGAIIRRPMLSMLFLKDRFLFILQTPVKKTKRNTADV